MNLLIASGHLGGDPETRVAKTGTAVSNFSLPVTQGWGDNEKVTWVRCTLFGKKGSGEPHGAVPYLTKGKLVTVQGEICLEEWESSDGQKKSSLSCIVKDMVIPKDSSSQAARPAQQAQQPQQAQPQHQPGDNEEIGRAIMDFDGDIPF